VPSVNKSIYSNPFSFHTQFLSYNVTEIAVGSVSSLAVTHSVISTELNAGTEIQNYAFTIRQRYFGRDLENGTCPGSPGGSRTFNVINLQCSGK